jgi:Neurotransmitter-gated ion-channel ligand binding domain
MLTLAQSIISVLAWRIPRGAVASLLKWSVVAALLYVLTPAMARAGGIETDTGLLSPPIVDNKPVNVRTGLFLTNLIDVDEVKEMFRISGYLFMTWKDHRLAFSPAGGYADRSYNPDSIWVPRVFLVNGAVQREKTNINVRGTPDGTIHYLELFKAELTTSFYLEPFPFDTESLEMFVQPFLDERDAITLEYDNQVGGVGTEPFVELAQWKILGVRGAAQRHAIARTGKDISELEIDVVVQRRYRYYIWKVFLPLIAMVAIAYSAFWIKISDYYTQISITLTVILTEIAFLFAISSSLPKVPYLTVIDAFFLVSFTFSCACIVELVAVHQSQERSRLEYAERVRTISRILYPVIYVAVLVLIALVFFAPAANR